MGNIILPGKKKKPALRKSERLRVLLPDLWALIAPRRWTMLFGLVLIAVSRVAGLVLPVSTKYLIDNVLANRAPGAGVTSYLLLGHEVTPGRMLVRLVLVVLAASTVQGVTGFALTQIFTRTTTRLIAELRCRLQSHIARLPLAFHDANKTGSLGSRIMNDVTGLQNLVGAGFLQFLGSLMTAAIALVLMISLSPRMTAVAFLSMLVLGLATGAATGKIRAVVRERAEINAELSGRLMESLGGIRVVKGYHAEAREERVFATSIQRLLVNLLDTVTYNSALGLVSNLLLGVVGAAVLFFGAREIMSGALTLGKFFTYTVFLQYLIAPISQVVTIGAQMTEALAGLERTREILRERPEDQDPARQVAIGPVTGEVVFDKVEFAYTDGSPVLHDFNFRALPGTVTALVGPSGSGKSTTIGLIAAFANPTSGKVTVNGVDLSTVRLDSYRTQLGVVLQETFLFDGTILENVAFARPAATEGEILAACRTARVDEFVQTFEHKYATVVGERGVKLSGGQRQRISIARAILADPRILILDEATSSLDSQSEALIQEGLSYLLKGRTTFVIAHRLSTIRRADQILVVEAGRIVERGTHDELLAMGGLYSDMYNTQHRLQENLFLAAGEGDKEEPVEKAQLSMAPGSETGTSGLVPFT